MITGDFHVHTTLSTDGRSDMKEMIDAASDKGIRIICFTEHMDYDNVFGNGDEAFVVDMDAYLRSFDECRQYAENKGVEIRFGIELGLQTYLADYYHSLAEGRPFDFIIGSSHIVRRMDCAFPTYFEAFPSVHDAVEAYFDAEVANAMCHNDFDIYGHLDYVLRYVPDEDFVFSPEEYTDSLDRLLNTLIKKEKGIEINTGGFRSRLNTSNPAPYIVRRYRELGGTLITIGSDAHVAADLASYFTEAEEILKEAGFRQYAVYKNRKPEFIDL
ncbi:MAG: histidinol-phosphatase HisJ family protein [Lachnospiraceae bacterium]|nr:histidinol-phosphatase HisJ family protein [Lachnospiraceae bacterium]